MIGVYTYRTLSGDDALRSLLGGSADNFRIDPRETSQNAPCMTYLIEPGSLSRHIHHDRIALKIFDINDDHLREIVERVMELMIIEDGDPPRHVAIEGVGMLTIYACVPNGGGELPDDNGDIIRIIYYDVTWRDYLA